MVQNFSLYFGSTLSKTNMWNIKISFSLLLYVVFTTIKTDADSSACEQKEKHLALLDLAKESISKAKDLHPTCVNDDKDISSNVSECGAKEKISAYLDIAMNLIEEAKKNYTDCDVTRNLTKIVLLHKKPIDCSEVLKNGDSKSGLYTIWPKHPVLEDRSLKVYCDMDTDGGGWTMIQRRGPFSKKIDFFRDWNDYKFGFGNISEEFWIGNENIFALTNQGNYSARFDIQTVDKEHRFATYSSFRTEDENAGYMLHFGDYNGTAGNGIQREKSTKFATKDKGTTSCSDIRKGGWWYPNCGLSNPNGLNLPGGKECEWKCMNWHTLTEQESLLAIEIKIRSEN